MTPDQLKASILQLAIQGKLVPQRPEDGTAEELYQQIQREKKKLTAAGKLKKEKLLPPISEEEIPFDIPESWKWVRLGNCLDVRDGTHDTPKYVDKGVPLVTSKNLKNGSIDFSTAKLISYDDYVNIAKRSNVDENDILFAMIGSIGNPVLYRGNVEFGIKNMALFKAVRNGALMEYVYYWSVLAEKYMKCEAQGGVQNFVSLSYLRKYVFPLPPLAEQRRIVQKIDQMLPLVEQYGEAYTALESLDARFPDDMRKSTLQYAIQGKLVPQRPEEGTAEELYQQIQKEKKKLIAAGKLKKEKPLPPISEDELPFDIPESWKWVHGRDLVNIISGTSYAKNDERHEGIRIIRGGNVKQGRVNLLNDDVYIDESLSDPEKTLVQGDIVIIGSTGSSKVIGNAGFVEKTDATSQIGAFLRILRAFCPETCDYLNVIFQSSYYKEHIVHEAKGTNINNIKASYINNFIIPIPPLEEQSRIVEKIGSLSFMRDVGGE